MQPGQDANRSLKSGVSRRGFLRTLALFGGAAAGGSLLAACAPAATPSPTPAPAKPAAAAPTTAPVAAPKPATGASPAAAAKPAAAASPAAQAAAKPAAKNLRTLKVGFIPLTDFLGMYAGIEQGYFAEEGLAIDLQAMAGGAAIIPALAGGSLDLGISNYLSVILANNQGIEVKVVSDSAYDAMPKPAHAIIVKKGGPIKSAKDLNGKRVAVNTRNNIVHVGTMEWLEKNGGDPKSVQVQELPFPQMPPALSQGQIDAAALVEPFVTVATSQDAEILAPYMVQLRDPMAIAGFVSTQDWIDKNREVAAGFARANAKGISFVEKNEKLARDYAVKYARLQPELASKINLATLRSDPLAPAVQFWIDMAKKWGLVEQGKELKPEQLFWKQ